MFTVNVRGGWADPHAMLRTLRRHDVDVLVIQELTPSMVGRAGRSRPGGGAAVRPPRSAAWLSGVGPGPRPGAPAAAAAGPYGSDSPSPRRSGGRPSSDARCRARESPTKGRATQWQHELAVLGSGLAGTPGPQVVAGDFNASRDHQPFRDVFAGVSWTARTLPSAVRGPDSTWPTNLDTRVSQDRPRFRDWLRTRRTLPVMRLDHVLVSWSGAVVREVRTIRIPGPPITGACWPSSICHWAGPGGPAA